jgi:putative transposase
MAKKNLNLSLEEKRKRIEKDHPVISLNRQCKLLNLWKGSLYYHPVAMDAYSMELMDKIDQEYTARPFYGSRKMTVFLNKQGHAVNRKRVQRLMRLMGIQAIYPGPNLSRRSHQHKIYPYLLRDVPIDRVNFVWSTDITYIRIQGGFIYLMAVIDWFSRYVLSWKLSNSLEASFCIDGLEEALEKAKPDIFNTDQGAQFTSDEFTASLEAKGVKISMDSKGRALDNIFVERLWRTVKYEEVYLKDYQSVSEAYHALADYFDFYNRERFHQSLDYRTPEEVYFNLKTKNKKRTMAH